MTLIPLAMSLLLGGAHPAGAEVREYRITVDGKLAGSYRMTIARQLDGTLVETGEANVSLRVFVKTYTYTYRGTEHWKDGKLVRLESASNDDGKRFQVSAEPGADGLRVLVNGQTKFIPADVWTMSFWHRPPQFRQGPVALLDVDTGKLIQGRLQARGIESLAVANVRTSASRYSISGGKGVDLWFDGGNRLLRMESVEDGYRTVIELTRLTR